MQLIYPTDTVQMQKWKILHNSLIRVRYEGTIEAQSEAVDAGAEPGQIEHEMKEHRHQAEKENR